MKNKNKAETAETDAKSSPKDASAKTMAKTRAKARDKAKPKPRAARARPAESAPEDAGKFDFIGKVETLLVKGGAGAAGFEFGLRGRHGKRRNFRLDAADPFTMNAMAHLVLAAHASEAKIGVRTGAEQEGVPLVTELASRPKLGKSG